LPVFRFLSILLFLIGFVTSVASCNLQLM